jgi:hypothetical protein
MKWFLYSFIVLSVFVSVSCAKTPADGKDEEVVKRGSIEVTAQLVEILGEFPPNKLYDYAYVLKYKVLKVHRGQLPGETILVGQYNPLKPRSKAADKRVEGIGGNLVRFKAGDIHRIALEPSIDDAYMGGILNEYAGKETGPIAWAVWTNLVTQP